MVSSGRKSALINITLVLNIVAIVATGTAVSIVHVWPLVSLVLAFVAGVIVTLSSRYAFGVAPEQTRVP